MESRHTCLGCGGSCHGVKVRLVGDAEIERIERIGAEMGVPDPVADGYLRFVDGRCPFQQGAWCGIHARYGADAKPRICGQYPLVVLRTEDGVRTGVDTGCYQGVRTWRSGDVVRFDDLFANEVLADPMQARHERVFVEAAGAPGATIAGLVRLVTMSGPGEGLPPGFGARVVRRLRASDLAPLIARRELGLVPGEHLRPVLDAVERLDLDALPWPVLDADTEAWAVDVVRRVVWLRLAHDLPVVQGVALLALSGALVCAWADPTPDRFGPAFAAWTRVMRARPFWRAVMPTPDVVYQLATGRSPPA